MTRVRRKNAEEEHNGVTYYSVGDWIKDIEGDIGQVIDSQIFPDDEDDEGMYQVYYSDTEETSWISGGEISVLIESAEERSDGSEGLDLEQHLNDAVDINRLQDDDFNIYGRRKQAAPFGGPPPEGDSSIDEPQGPPGGGAGSVPPGEAPGPDMAEEPSLDSGAPDPRLPEDPMGMDIPMDVDVNVQDKSVSINMGDTAITISRKEAISQEWRDIMGGTTLTPEEPNSLSKDTHEYIMNNPSNRRQPAELFDVKVSPGGKFADVEDLEFALRETLHADIETSDDTITIKSVENPAALIEELSGHGLDASLVSGDLVDIYEGMKVSFLGDLPEVGFQNDPAIKTTARVTAIEGGDYYLYNDKLGNFVATLEEIYV